MSTPVRRRPSPAVYRRRRLVLLLALLVIVAVGWLLIAQPWRGGATPASDPAGAPVATTPAPKPTIATSAGPDTAEDAAAAARATAPATDALPQCTSRDVTVEAVVDQDTYGSDQNPQFSIRLTNTSGADCQLNVGTTTQKFTVSSGTDTYWRSTDCQTEPSDMTVTLAAGRSVSSAAPITWDRTRSSVDTCDDPNRSRAAAGGASYHLAVEIGGIRSTSTAQFLLY